VSGIGSCRLEFVEFVFLLQRAFGIANQGGGGLTKNGSRWQVSKRSSSCDGPESDGDGIFRRLLTLQGDLLGHDMLPFHNEFAFSTDTVLKTAMAFVTFQPSDDAVIPTTRTLGTSSALFRGRMGKKVIVGRRRRHAEGRVVGGLMAAMACRHKRQIGWQHNYQRIISRVQPSSVGLISGKSKIGIIMSTTTDAQVVFQGLINIHQILQK
jgi:hypothetical protein